MAAYILRDIDEDLWRKVKSKAAAQGVTAKDVLLKLLAEWVKKAGAVMTSTNLPLYRLLVKFGASEADADSAASLDDARLATKADLSELRLVMKADLAEMKASIIQWNLIALGFVTALFSGLVTLLRFKP